MKCEASKLAQLKGDWAPESDPAPLLVGNYVHSYFESPEAHEKFKKENQSALYKSPTVNQIKAELDRFGIPYGKSAKKDVLLGILNDNGKYVHGDLYAHFEVAENMIKALERQTKIMKLWNGKKEEIVTGELFGVQWKGKIDLLSVENSHFVDLKTTANMYKRFWSKKYGTWVSFVEEYGYALQMAVYETLLEKQYGKPFKPSIIAVSKKDIPNVRWIEMFSDEAERLKEYELEQLEMNIERISKVKNGEVEPTYCGKCDYCKLHTIEETFVSPSELIE